MANPELPAADYVAHLAYTRAKVALRRRRARGARRARDRRSARARRRDRRRRRGRDVARSCPTRRASPRPPRRFANADTAADDPAVWIATSGSTGRPRAAVHGHRGFAFSIEAYARGVLGLGADDVTLSVPKLYFGYATGMSLLFPLAVGRDGRALPRPPDARAHVRARRCATARRCSRSCPRSSRRCWPPTPTRDVLRAFAGGAARDVGGRVAARAAARALAGALRRRDRRGPRLGRALPHPRLEPPRRRPPRDARPRRARLRGARRARRRRRRARRRDRRAVGARRLGGAPLRGRSRAHGAGLSRKGRGRLGRDERQGPPRGRRLHLRGPQRRHAQGGRHLRLAARGRERAPAAPRRERVRRRRLRGRGRARQAEGRRRVPRSAPTTSDLFGELDAFARARLAAFKVPRRWELPARRCPATIAASS